MCKKFTIIYVFGPARCTESYMNGEILERNRGEYVKIGKTDCPYEFDECTEEALEKTAAIRCNQESKTGIPDWCNIYDIFLLPRKNGQNIDDAIRNLLCNDVYSLVNSKDESKEQKGDIKPGKEFVYGVSRNHIKHAVESYCFQLIANCSSDNPDELAMLQKLCKYNANIPDVEDDPVEDKQGGQSKSGYTNRDISLILSPGDTVYLTNHRNKNSIVTDVDGHQICATYDGGKKFHYGDGEPKSASKLAIELIGRFAGITYDTINGNSCWVVKSEDNPDDAGVTLADMYDTYMSSSNY